MRLTQVSAIALTLVFSLLPVHLSGWSSSVAIAEGKPPKIDRRERAMLLISKAEWVYSARFPEASLPLYEQGFRLLQEVGDRTQEADVLMKLANRIRFRGRLQAALPYYQRVLALHQKGIVVAAPQRLPHQGKASAIAIGDIYQASGQFDQALSAYEQALAFKHEIEGEWTNANIVTKMGTVHHLAGRPERAIAAYQQAQSLYRRTGDNLPGVFFQKTKLLNRVGLVYQSQGQTKLALAAYQQGLDALKNKRGEPERIVDRVLTLENIRDLYQAQGEKAQVAAYTQQAKEALSEPLPALDVGGTDHFRRAEVLATIGSFYLESGQLKRAKYYYDRAVAIARESPFTPAEDNILSRIRTDYRQLGRLEETLSVQQRQMEISRSKGQSINIASSLRFLGETYQQLQQWQAALSAYQQALSTFQPSQKSNREPLTIALLRFRIGTVYQAQGQPEQALTAYQQALALYQELQFPEGQVQVLQQIGKLYEAQGKVELAQQHYQQAETLLNQLLSFFQT